MIQLEAPPYTFFVSYIVEGIFLGINCVLFGFCVYILWGHLSSSSRALLLIDTLLFLLGTTQNILHAVLYFIVFIVHNGHIRPYLEYVNAHILAPIIIFHVTFITTGFLSIWRLYLLYENGIIVCIPAFMVWIAQICISGINIHFWATTSVTSAGFSPVMVPLWVLISVLNLYVAVFVCIRLCIAQKRTHTVLSPSTHKSIAIVLVECNALITLCGVAETIIIICNYTYSFVSNGIATQIAIASQLLVTARYGLLSQGRPTRPTGPTTTV